MLERIKRKLDGYDEGWNMSLNSDSFSFMITYHGLLLTDDNTERTLLIEWSELEDILEQEIISSVLGNVN